MEPHKWRYSEFQTLWISTRVQKAETSYLVSTANGFDLGRCCRELERKGSFHKWYIILPTKQGLNMPPQSALPMKRPTRRIRPKGYWLKEENRRKFFFELAAEQGFDPLKPENWAKVSQHQVVSKKVSKPTFPFSEGNHYHLPEGRFYYIASI